MGCGLREDGLLFGLARDDAGRRRRCGRGAAHQRGAARGAVRAPGVLGELVWHDGRGVVGGVCAGREGGLRKNIGRLEYYIASYKLPCCTANTGATSFYSIEHIRAFH